MSLLCNPGRARKFLCFPLSVGCIIFAICKVVTAILLMYFSLTPIPKYIDIIINSGFDIGFGLILLVSVFYHFSWSTLACFIYYVAAILWKLASFIVFWVAWGKVLAMGFNLNDVAITELIKFSVIIIIDIIVLLMVANAVLSTALVFKAGGNGWEWKNFDEIRKAKKTEKENTDDKV